MCGRYVTPAESEIERAWHIGRHNSNPFGPRYNVSPTALVPILRGHHPRGYDFTFARWGLIPFWWKQAAPPRHTFNSRAEEASSKPMWRGPLSKSRCLVPALGWYEWKEVERIDPHTGEVTRTKRPHFIRLPDSRPFCFAGLMSSTMADGQEKLSCSIITQDAVGPVAEVHTRMPIALPEDAHAAWLDPAMTDATKAIGLARERALIEFAHHAVSARVNSARNEGAELIVPLAGE